MAEVGERQVGYVSKSYGFTGKRVNVCADGAEFLRDISTTTKPPRPPVFNPVALPLPSGQIQFAFYISDIQLTLLSRVT